MLLTASFERHEPKRCGIDAMAAGCEQAMVLMDSGRNAFESRGDIATCVALDRYLSSLVLNDDMILEERASVLGEGWKWSAQCRVGGPVERMGVAHGQDVRVGVVHGCVHRL